MTEDNFVWDRSLNEKRNRKKCYDCLPSVLLVPDPPHPRSGAGRRGPRVFFLPSPLSTPPRAANPGKRRGLPPPKSDASSIGSNPRYLHSHARDCAWLGTGTNQIAFRFGGSRRGAIAGGLIVIGGRGMVGVLSNRVDRDDLKAGDHIYTWRAAYIYAHQGTLPLLFPFIGLVSNRSATRFGSHFEP